MNSLDRAIERVVQYLEGQAIPYMIFGGLANLKWGRSRLTEDVDVKVQIEEAGWARFIGGLAPHFTALAVEPLAFARSTHVVPAETPERVRIDFVLATLPYEHSAIARAVSLPLGSVTAKLCTAEDLIVHKIISERLRDREDVEGVVLRQRGGLDRNYLDPLIRVLARDLERPGITDFYRECLRKAGLSGF